MEKYIIEKGIEYELHGEQYYLSLHIVQSNSSLLCVLNGTKLTFLEIFTY